MSSHIKQLLLTVIVGFQLVIDIMQFVQEEGIDDLHDIGYTGVVHTLSGPLFGIDHRLNHGTEDVGIDILPIQFATLQDDAPRLGSHTGNGNATGEESTIDVWELGDDVWGIIAALRTVHDVEGFIQVIA